MSKPNKKLQSEWDKKLKDSGFKDIEGKDGRLVKDISGRLDQDCNDPFKMEYKNRYYRLAGSFLHEYENFTEYTRKVWDLHQQGVSVREISEKTLEEDKGRKNKKKKSSVYNIIKSLSKEMLAKYRAEYEQEWSIYN